MSTASGPVLIVEDVPNVLELLEVTLRFKGYAVITARNGEEALKVIDEQRPALIVTDILMPKMDGYAFVQKLRLNPDTRSIPVVFLSATYSSRSSGRPVFPYDSSCFLLINAMALNQGMGKFLQQVRVYN